MPSVAAAPMPVFDVAGIILAANLGRERRDAQIDTCTVFSAALFDVLTNAGMACEVWCSQLFLAGRSGAVWAHSAVNVGGYFFDSMGLFNHEIARARGKIHPKVETQLVLQPDARDFDEIDYPEMYAHYAQALGKALRCHLDAGALAHA